MKPQIRDMRPADMDGKGYVHWKSWQETYSGLIPEASLAKRTLERCQDVARRWPENTSRSWAEKSSALPVTVCAVTKTCPIAAK